MIWDLGFGIWDLLWVINLHDFPSQNFLLGNANLLVARFPRQRALEQLARPLAGQHDELEPIFLGCSFHEILRAGLLVRRSFSEGGKTRPYTVYLYDVCYL